MRKVEIQSLFRRLGEKGEEAPDSRGKRKPKGNPSSKKPGKPARIRRIKIKSGKVSMKTSGRSAAALENLESLGRENRLLVQQLIQASSMIREMEEKVYDESRKHTLGKIMVAGLLHDLRNPLAVISSCAQFSLEEQEEDGPVREKLQMIVESVKKANDLAKSFLDHTKTSVLDYRPVNINRTLMMMWKMSELQSIPRKVDFVADLDKALPEITGSQENLERVFLNVFMNAIHAVSGSGGQVRVQTRFLPPEKRAEIKITDNGPGIPKEQRDRIFEPFYTTKEEGTGLGLNISQSLILQHGGQITLESEVGKGTTVSINLPLEQDDPSPRINAMAL
jgi:two-component system, NtrC family, sensor histidine kinase HydH